MRRVQVKHLSRWTQQGVTKPKTIKVTFSTLQVVTKVRTQTTCSIKWPQPKIRIQTKTVIRKIDANKTTRRLIQKRISRGITSWKITQLMQSLSQSTNLLLRALTRRAKAEALLHLTTHPRIQFQTQTSSIRQWGLVRVQQASTKLSAIVIANQCLMTSEAAIIDHRQARIVHPKLSTVAGPRLDGKRVDRGRKALRELDQSLAATM